VEDAGSGGHGTAGGPGQGSGCGCSLPDTRHSTTALLMAGLLGLGLVGRRRQRGGR
jgi:MYXO-CTERM domain-containing protein